MEDTTDLTPQRLSLLLHEVADMQNDARDHDEYHAAAVVSLQSPSDPYVTRWIEGLLRAYREGLVLRA